MLTSPSPQAQPADPALANRIPMLEYHDSEYKMGATVQMKTAWFLEQMQWLSDNHFKTLTGEELIQFALGRARPPQKSFSLRFDLGLPVYQNFHDVIIPALERHSFHAFFFVLTNNIKDTCKDNYICWGQLQEWEQAGLIEVGSHGVYHPDYRKITATAWRWDAKESKRVIEAKLGHPISFLAYPYDSAPDRPAALLKPLSYQLAFAGPRAERSVLFKDSTPYALPCYYPYSNPKIYPAINGARGLTFGQMILGAVTAR